MRNYLIVTFVLLSVTTLADSADGQAQQTKSQQPSQIETRTDRFSGITNITLKPIVLFKKQDHKLAISMETKIDPKKPNEDVVFVNFISYSEYPLNFGDREIHCLIDGKPLRLGVAERGDLALFPGSAETLFTGISLNHIDRISNGKNVEMRLGSVEWTFSEQVLSVLREFVQTAKSHSKDPK
jgi:hypothetical protein